MAGLTNIFGGSDDSSSSNDQNFSNDLVSDVTAAVGLDASSSNSNYSQDEDGNVESSQSDQNLGLDIDTDSLLGSVTDGFSSSDQTSE